MVQHEYKTFTRDGALSLSARGVLLVVSLPEFDEPGASMVDLLAYSSEGADELGPWLDELTTAGYVRRDDSGKAVVWRATSKAFSMTAEEV